MGPLNLLGMARYPAIAADQNGTPYVIYRVDGLAPKRGLLFTRDEGFGVGNWREPILLNDTTATDIAFASIDVSPDGSEIVVAAYDMAPGWDFGHVLFTRSTDGGQTFTPMIVAIHADSLPFGKLNAPSIHLGTDGYMFIEYLAVIDTTGGDTWAKGIVYSTDHGATWSSPEFLPQPEGYVWTWNWWAVTGTGLVLNNIPHLTAYFWNPDVGRRIFEFHKVGDQWIYAPVSPPWEPDRYGDADQATLGVDSAGNLYIAFDDRSPAGSGYQVYVSGSRDGMVYYR